MVLTLSSEVGDILGEGGAHVAVAAGEGARQWVVGVARTAFGNCAFKEAGEQGE